MLQWLLGDSIWHHITHWSRVMHICISKLNIIGSHNGLSPGRRQAIIRTNAWILLIRTSETKFSEILSEIHTFSFKKMHLKMSSGKWRPLCLSLNVLTGLTWIQVMGWWFKAASHYVNQCWLISEVLWHVTLEKLQISATRMPLKIRYLKLKLCHPGASGLKLWLVFVGISIMIYHWLLHVHNFVIFVMTVLSFEKCSHVLTK